MSKINLPLGIDNFEKLRTSGCYYIDKTGFIKELLDETFEVNLITRPRRFGKTLTMSMLAEFLDIRKESRELFLGLEISEYEEFCKGWMNQWPVLFLTLKDANGKTFEGAFNRRKFVEYFVFNGLFDTISYFDYKEDYYHAFVAGLFTGAGYEVSSNSEQGMLKACEEALLQIERQQYAQNLKNKGYETVLCEEVSDKGAVIVERM